jgi:hypothetical protein
MTDAELKAGIEILPVRAYMEGGPRGGGTNQPRLVLIGSPASCLLRP